MSVSKTTWYEIEYKPDQRGWIRDSSDRHHRPPDLQAEANQRECQVKLVEVTETRETLATAIPRQMP